MGKNRAIETSDSGKEFDAKMPPRRSSKTSTPKSNPASRRRVTCSSSAEDDEPEQSPEVPRAPSDDATEVDMENEGGDRDSELARGVEITPTPGGLALPEVAAGLWNFHQGEAWDSEESEDVVSHEESENLCDDSEELALNDEKLGNGDSCLSGEGAVEDRNWGALGTEGNGIEENHVNFAMENENINFICGAELEEDESDGEAVQDEILTMNGDNNGLHVDEVNGLDADMDDDLVEEETQPLPYQGYELEPEEELEEEEEEEEEEDDDDDDDDSQLACDPGNIYAGAGAGAEHSLVEEESLAVGTEEGDAREEGDWSCEDDEEDDDDGYEEIENDGDNSEGSEYGSDDDEIEDNEEIEEYKSPDKSVDLSEKIRMKGLEVHVGGLDKETVEQDLIEVFGKFGEIQSARIIKHPRRRSRGFAFIQYATIEQAKNVVSELKDGIEVRGKRVKVSSSWENATLFMDNICKSWTKEHVLDKLKEYGIEHIEEVRLPSDPESKGQIKGFAFLEFCTHMDAVAAHQRLRRADAVFGCDRSAEVAFMKNQVPSSEDLSQIKAAISRRRGGLEKAENGEPKVKKSNEKTPRKKTEAHAKSKEAEKDRKRTEQASSSKTRSKGTTKRGKAVSEEKRKRMGSKASARRPKSSGTENRVVGVPLKSTTVRNKRRPLPTVCDDRGKRKVGHGHDNRPLKKLRGNDQRTPRNAIRSPRRNPRIRERPAHAHSTISRSKRLRLDMEPHAGYVEPAALKQVQRQTRYLEQDIGNYSERRVRYLEPAFGSRHQSRVSYLEPALESRHQSRVSYLEPALESRHQSRVSYLEPALESRHQSRVSYLEPALENKHQRYVSYHEPFLRKEALPHVGYLEPPARTQSRYDYHHGLRRDDRYDSQISSRSTYARESALSSHVPSPRYRSYSRYEAGSSRGSGYHHKSYPPRR